MKMKLRKEPFEQMLLGIKRVEIRLFDEKRQTLKTGEELRFVLTDDETRYIQTTVVGLHRFKSFKELFLSPLAGATGFDESDPDGNAQKMYAYYPPEEEARYGALAVEISLIEHNCNDFPIDIHSKGVWKELSNFYPHPFTFDGVYCASMEGFLQALKFKSEKKQRKVCSLVGSRAKAAGTKKLLWKLFGRIYWQGKKYRRESEEFKALVTRAYATLYNENGRFRAALKASGGRPLVHSIGKSDPKKTILTEKEFIDNLLFLREK